MSRSLSHGNLMHTVTAPEAYARWHTLSAVVCCGWHTAQEEMDPSGPAFSMVATKRGGFWGHRLQQRCHTLMGDTGEEELYSMHTAGGVAPMINGVCTQSCLRNAALLKEALAPPPEPTPPPAPTPPSSSKKGKKTKKAKGKRKRTQEEL
jgi:hypothetical protein